MTDLITEDLDKGDKKPASVRNEEEPLPKECPKCKFIRQPKEPVCPNCGFQAEKKSKIKCDDGELVEITSDKIKKPKFTPEMKQKWYSMFLHHAREKNYSRGWAANSYRSKFDVWPRGLEESPVEPDDEVLKYITHLRMKFRLSKDRVPAS